MRQNPILRQVFHRQCTDCVCRAWHVTHRAVSDGAARHIVGMVELRQTEHYCSVKFALDVSHCSITL